MASGRTGVSKEFDLASATAPQADDAAGDDPARPGGPPHVAAAWARVRGRLQDEVGDVEYRSWLRQIGFAGLDGDEVTLTLPTRFMRDWVRSRYSDRLTALWRAQDPRVRRVDIRVGDGAGSGPGLAESLAAAEPAPMSAAARGDELMDSRGGASGLDKRFDFDSFVVGKPNEFAYACARRVAEQPASPAFNPLFLYGGVGLGKTHLMHAIAWELLRKQPPPRVSVTYLTAEKFMYRFIAAIRNHAQIEFKRELRSADVLMIDDVEFLIGKENTQEEFFHTFNALVDAGRQIVVSAEKSPSEIGKLDERLRTRLGCGMVADLHTTTYELRLAILAAKASRAGVAVPPKVMEFLANKITSNVRELEAALNRLIAHANLFGRPLNLETTHEVLHDVLKAHDRRVTIDEIQRRVAEHFHVRLSDMSSPRRARAVARPRQVAMYLAKQLTERSLPEIGRMFGNRDHTTVMHAVARITELTQRDAAFAEDVELLRRMLES